MKQKRSCSRSRSRSGSRSRSCWGVSTCVVKMNVRLNGLVNFSVADPRFLSRIPDPTFFHPRPRIRTVSSPDLRSSSKNLGILTLNKAQKRFPSSMTFSHFGSRIPNPGIKKAPNPGTLDPDPQHWLI